VLLLPVRDTPTLLEGTEKIKHWKNVWPGIQHLGSGKIRHQFVAAWPHTLFTLKYDDFPRGPTNGELPLEFYNKVQYLSYTDICVEIRTKCAIFTRKETLLTTTVSVFI
jgi:hypothetical protein